MWLYLKFGPVLLLAVFSWFDAVTGLRQLKSESLHYIRFPVGCKYFTKPLRLFDRPRWQLIVNVKYLHHFCVGHFLDLFPDH